MASSTTPDLTRSGLQTKRKRSRAFSRSNKFSPQTETQALLTDKENIRFGARMRDEEAEDGASSPVDAKFIYDADGNPIVDLSQGLKVLSQTGERTKDERVIAKLFRRLPFAAAEDGSPDAKRKRVVGPLPNLGPSTLIDSRTKRRASTQLTLPPIAVLSTAGEEGLFIRTIRLQRDGRTEDEPKVTPSSSAPLPEFEIPSVGATSEQENESERSESVDGSPLADASMEMDSSPNVSWSNGGTEPSPITKSIGRKLSNVITPLFLKAPSQYEKPTRFLQKSDIQFPEGGHYSHCEEGLIVDHVASVIARNPCMVEVDLDGLFEFMRHKGFQRTKLALKQRVERYTIHYIVAGGKQWMSTGRGVPKVPTSLY